MSVPWRSLVSSAAKSADPEYHRCRRLPTEQAETAAPKALILDADQAVWVTRLGLRFRTWPLRVPRAPICRPRSRTGTPDSIARTLRALLPAAPRTAAWR